jgi:hypothetical protein
MTTIKSSTTTTTAYSVEADTTGALVIQTGVTPTTALTISSGQAATFAGNVTITGTLSTGNSTPQVTIYTVVLVHTQHQLALSI